MNKVIIIIIIIIIKNLYSLTVLITNQKVEELRNGVQESITNKIKKRRENMGKFTCSDLTILNFTALKILGLKNVDLGPFYSKKIGEMT